MLYALLMYQDADFDTQWERASDAERAAVYRQHGDFSTLLESRGAERGGHELALAATATTVRKADDTAADGVVTDGPFAELAEHLGGFYIVEARDLDEALEYAKALPVRTVEVRAIITDDQRAE
ncbi:YciI family protein [Conexibacter arvalis]|uniref:YCII-related domain-containing protein n=1 Tax=Conexibacter arvalis TaxID=912552 RepID=A0A840IAR4_9ACTN|nr:YciI family protein [Conexibacter arvalis]MBB4661916.1 hypothetical protein [Conexibacter arvalis]